MLKTRIGSIALAATAAYGVNAILVAVTDQLLSPMAADGNWHFHFLVIDLVSQCLYTVAAGYLCAAIAGHEDLDQLGLGGGNILPGDLVEHGSTLVRHQLASCLCPVRVARLRAKVRFHPVAPLPVTMERAAPTKMLGRGLGRHLPARKLKKSRPKFAWSNVYSSESRISTRSNEYERVCISLPRWRSWQVP